MQRIENVNTSISEQVFLWFRKYAHTFNEMKMNRHHFLVLLFFYQHNEALEANRAGYLNPYSYQNKGPSNKRRYLCYDTDDESAE